jgi:hypothetical protein
LYGLGFFSIPIVYTNEDSLNCFQDNLHKNPLWSKGKIFHIKDGFEPFLISLQVSGEVDKVDLSDETSKKEEQVHLSAYDPLEQKDSLFKTFLSILYKI